MLYHAPVFYNSNKEIILMLTRLELLINQYNRAIRSSRLKESPSVAIRQVENELNSPLIIHPNAGGRTERDCLQAQKNRFISLIVPTPSSKETQPISYLYECKIINFLCGHEHIEDDRFFIYFQFLQKINYLYSSFSTLNESDIVLKNRLLELLDENHSLTFEHVTFFLNLGYNIGIISNVITLLEAHLPLLIIKELFILPFINQSNSTNLATAIRLLIDIHVTYPAILERIIQEPKNKSNCRLTTEAYYGLDRYLSRLETLLIISVRKPRLLDNQSFFSLLSSNFFNYITAEALIESPLEITDIDLNPTNGILCDKATNIYLSTFSNEEKEKIQVYFDNVYSLYFNDQLPASYYFLDDINKIVSKLFLLKKQAFLVIKVIESLHKFNSMGKYMMALDFLSLLLDTHPSPEFTSFIGDLYLNESIHASNIETFFSDPDCHHLLPWVFRSHFPVLLIKTIELIIEKNRALQCRLIISALSETRVAFQPESVVSALVKLHKSGVLGSAGEFVEEIVKLVIEHHNPIKVANAIAIIIDEQPDLLTNKTLEIFQNRIFCDENQAVEILVQCRQLFPDHYKKEELAPFLCDLSKISSVILSSLPFKLAKSFMELANQKHLNSDIYFILFKTSQKINFAHHTYWLGKEDKVYSLAEIDLFFKAIIKIAGISSVMDALKEIEDQLPPEKFKEYHRIISNLGIEEEQVAIYEEYERVSPKKSSDASIEATALMIVMEHTKLLSRRNFFVSEERNDSPSLTNALAHGNF